MTPNRAYRILLHHLFTESRDSVASVAAPYLTHLSVPRIFYTSDPLAPKVTRMYTHDSSFLESIRFSRDMYV
jgi:hypothetical protein